MSGDFADLAPESTGRAGAALSISDLPATIVATPFAHSGSRAALSETGAQSLIPIPPERSSTSNHMVISVCDHPDCVKLLAASAART